MSNSYGPSSTYAIAERSSKGFFSSAASVFPAPAEALLGTSPTTKVEAEAVGEESEGNSDWAQTFKKHLAQRRALPTTIESFDEDDEVKFMQQFTEGLSLDLYF